MPICLMTPARVQMRSPTKAVAHIRQNVTEPITVDVLSSNEFGGNAAAASAGDDMVGWLSLEAIDRRGNW